MVSVQLISGRIGRVTGRGLAVTLKQQYPRGVVRTLVALLALANTINIGADLSAMGAAVQLLVGGSPALSSALLGLGSMLLLVFVPYRRYVVVMKWLTLAVLAYVATAFAVEVPWAEVLRATLWPRLAITPETITAVVAVLGTTISPYLFFWQASQEVEEQQAASDEQPLKQAPQQARRQFGRMGFDTAFGMAVSNGVAFFIILTTAVTLHAHGVQHIDSAAQAAEALKPVAGRFAFGLFALGLVGTGLLAVPVLAGSTGYAVADTLGWRSGLERRPPQAKGFYGVIAASVLLGIAMTFSPLNPIRALFWTAVINGVISVPILVFLMLIASRHRVMGRFVISLPLRLLGWLTTATMALAVIAMAWTSV
jgi:Mn2+/Fe2+ NRAMP family transporter